MNSLSWFLYLADVIGNIQGLLIFFAVISGLSTLVWFFAKAYSVTDNDESAGRFANFTWYIPWVFVSTAFLASVIPSKDTIYLIAGSEAGEAVVTSTEGQEILNDIKEVIRYQLGELKGTTEKSSVAP